ncbi:expressed unknown protein [Seminavis robusta]|uniref:FAD-binding FR-type domain-containing protein n=1 Tax=Seminavis robusta TaxID=568900 RepID=A0A9N8H7C7_9STRA|nr:expressed unknown protein [Seminavis robusta]|eukprot:Sro125_g060080.1 n/a (253) ;mRNA; f:15089-15847
MLHVTLADPKQDIQLDYQPGHVLALELEDKSDDLNDDAKRNGGWMRGPYTVSRSSKDSIDVLVRVVGKKSKAFSESPEGTPVRFGGKFKVPILVGVKKEDTKSVVLVSTGVGIGPCVGAIELAMEDDSFPPIALFASFRDPEDVVYDDYLSQMAKENPTKFQWHPIVTSESGRISSCEENLEHVCNFATPDSHYHMIGNGQLVNEWKAGLAQAGVPEDKVTVEQYFNHKAESDQGAINNIANAIAMACAVEA